MDSDGSPDENSRVRIRESLTELIYLVRATPASLIRKRPGGATSLSLSFFSNNLLTRGFPVFTQ